MNIPCTHCLTPNEVTLPPSNPDGGMPSISVRCSACGNVFSTNKPLKKKSSPWDAPSADSGRNRGNNQTIEPPVRVPPAAAAYPHQPKYTPPKVPTYKISQDGNTYEVQDMAAVQRWIVENRLTRDGKISTDGQWWDRLGDRPEFKSFFEMLDRIHALESNPEPTIQKYVPPPTQAPPKIERPILEKTEPKPVAKAVKQAAALPPIEDISLEEKPSDFDFTPPATEEIPFDRPNTDEKAITASELSQQPASEPTFSTAVDTLMSTLPPEPETSTEPKDLTTEATTTSIYDQYPSFSETDLPTEEELQVASSEPEEDHSIAFIDEDWPTEQMELSEDLEWVSAKKQKNRIVVGLVLILLLGITTKTIVGMSNEPTSDESIPEGIVDAWPEGLANAEEESEEVEAQEDADGSAEAEAEGEAQEDAGGSVEANEEANEATAVNVPEPQAQPARSQAAPTVRRTPPATQSQPTEDAGSYMTAGREAMAEGNYRAARIAFLDAVDIEPQNPEANHGLAYAAHRQDDIPFAMRYYCRALSLAQPGSALAADIQSSLDSLHLECNG